MSAQDITLGGTVRLFGCTYIPEPADAPVYLSAVFTVRPPRGDQVTIPAQPCTDEPSDFEATFVPTVAGGHYFELVVTLEGGTKGVANGRFYVKPGVVALVVSSTSGTPT